MDKTKIWIWKEPKKKKKGVDGSSSRTEPRFELGRDKNIKKIKNKKMKI